ncbi:MAG: glycosyltransferase family 39 protein, partial [Syntrophomonadaceae bacterium]
MKRLGPVLLGGAATLVVLRLWVMPLFSSLWLDEFGTVWVTDAGLAGVVERLRLFPQSPAYAGLVAVGRTVLGSSEPALRLPSIVAMLAAVLLVGRLARSCFGRAAGAPAAGVFLLFPAIEFAAVDARPYAFAVLFATAALLALRRLLESGRPGDAAAYVGAAAGSVYFHYLFAAGLPAHVVYALWRRRRGAGATDAVLAGTGVGLAALLTPAAIVTAGIARGRAAHAFGALPGALPLLNALVPVRVLALLVPVVGIAFLLGARGLRPPVEPGESRGAAVLLGAAALSPPIVLFAASWILRTNLFEGRYLLAAAAPWAVLLGGVLAEIGPPGASRAVVAAALALALVLRGELLR